MLGGTAFLGKPERYWFVSQISLVGMESLKLDWNCAEDVLTTLLWRDSAGGLGRRQVWHEVMKA